MIPMIRQPTRRLLAAAILLAACSGDATGPRVINTDLAREWPTTSPTEVGIDAGLMNDATAHARSLPSLFSLLVVRHGNLAVEEYFNGNTAQSLNDVRSVTKSIVSTLTGIAVRRGALHADDPIGPFLNAIAPTLEPAKRAITIENLLTMRSGFQWQESGSIGYNEWILSGNPIGFLLDKPLVAQPGLAFNYNSAAVHLLSVVVQEAVGETLPDFARTNLFTPLGISRATWEVFSDGRVNGGAGIDLRPRDLAKIGALWLQHGSTGPQQILDPVWVALGTSPTGPFTPSSGPLREISYGWLWWLAPPGAPEAFFAWGYGGQFIWVVPSLDAVIVVTTDWRNPAVSADQLVTNAMDLIVNYVVPALK
jgi:CubicO group peptidase (beta-lactamase class C family)